MPERATIANMTIEMGATTGVFPSDETTYRFMKAQGRESDWVELVPDLDAEYEKYIEIDLCTLEPLVAKPHMPDLVEEAVNLRSVKVDSVFIGSCTNASYSDISKAAKILKGKKVSKDVDLTVAPGSKQVLEQLLEDDVLPELVRAGARILECACGPCIGIGQVPSAGSVALRTSNRNFPGRSGNNDAFLYLSSPETAAASAVRGYITPAYECLDVEELAECVEPDSYIIDDSMFITPADVEDRSRIEVISGENITSLPSRGPLKEEISAAVILKLGDNITTDDIIPGGANILKYIANIPKFAEYTFHYTDPTFVERAKRLKTSVIVGGDNYGQGSSREHAALLPMYLGVEAVIAKSYARIHKENLINYGILPLVFKNKDDYEKIGQDDRVVITDILSQVEDKAFVVKLEARDVEIETVLEVSEYDKNVLIKGGALNYLRDKLKN